MHNIKEQERRKKEFEESMGFELHLGVAKIPLVASHDIQSGILKFLAITARE